MRGVGVSRCGRAGDGAGRVGAGRVNSLVRCNNYGVLAYLPGKQNADARTGFHGRTHTLLAKNLPVSRILHGLVRPLLTLATPPHNSGAR